jgi:hypothetical protein
MNKIKLENELRYNGNAQIITTHKGKSHNELGSRSIIIAKIGCRTIEFATQNRMCCSLKTLLIVNYKTSLLR